MKHSLQLRLSQHLTLTPQLQQSIRLLQLSTIELNQELERLLQENPLLEREDGIREEPPVHSDPDRNEITSVSSEATATPAESHDDAPGPNGESALDMFDGTSSASYRDDDDDRGDYPQLAAEQPNLREHLRSQLFLTKLSERDHGLVAMLIDSLDDNGYLTQELSELVEMLPSELEVDVDDLQVALRHLQQFDPCGVGARNLGECLALQLAALPETTPCRDTALTLVRDHLELLATRDFVRLKKLLRCDDDCLRTTQELITHLNPRPGREFSGGDIRYVIPDVVVRKHKGMWIASLNAEAMPKLRINRLYADILSRNRDSGAHQLSGQLQEAKWLIKNVQQRFDTILRVSQAIVDRQRHFFEHGEVAMRPLVLREIADTLNLHESTISRVTTQKFMLTPRGILELKYFFGSRVGTEAGGVASSTAIRALIKQFVSSENSKKPLSDGQISEILGRQGIVVARRTVAKYRESMQILPVNLRKTP